MVPNLSGEQRANMGKKLDALLGRSFKASKFKTLVKVAISRLAILKKQHHARYSLARSDVAQLLHLGYQDRALLRVEYVIKEQNMLDVLAVIEDYCHLLQERVMLIQNNKECPDELKEAISSLVFAASRFGEFPELQQIRGILTTRFGKEFADRAVGLHSSCGVNTKIALKLSTRQTGLESRMAVLTEIAIQNGIALHLEKQTFQITEENLDMNQKQKQNQPELKMSASLDDSAIRDNASNLSEEVKWDQKLSESMKTKYTDVVAAAQDAFESAAYAAAAARVAVELSRSKLQDTDPDDHFGSNHQGIVLKSDDSSKSKLYINKNETSEKNKHSNKELGFDNTHSIDYCISESESGEVAESSRSHLEELKPRVEAGIGSSDSDEDILNERNKPLSLLSQKVLSGKNVVFDENDDSTRMDEGDIAWLKQKDMDARRDCSPPMDEFPTVRQHNAVADKDISNGDGYKLHGQSLKWIPLRFEAKSMAQSVGSSLESKYHINSAKQLHSQGSNIYRKPVSVRTRQVHRDIGI